MMMTALVVGAIIGAAATTRNDKPVNRAYNRTFLLAANESESWWHAKIQDAIDVLASRSYHRPGKRVVVTNAEARETRIKFLSMLPDENNGCRYEFTTAKHEQYSVENVNLNLRYQFGFKRYGSNVVPVAFIECNEIEGRFWSYDELRDAVLKKREEAMNMMKLLPGNKEEEKREIKREVERLLERRRNLDSSKNVDAEEDLSKSIEWE